MESLRFNRSSSCCKDSAIRGSRNDRFVGLARWTRVDGKRLIGRHAVLLLPRPPPRATSAGHQEFDSLSQPRQTVSGSRSPTDRAAGLAVVRVRAVGQRRQPAAERVSFLRAHVLVPLRSACGPRCRSPFSTTNLAPTPAGHSGCRQASPPMVSKRKKNLQPPLVKTIIAWYSPPAKFTQHYQNHLPAQLPARVSCHRLPTAHQ